MLGGVWKYLFPLFRVEYIEQANAEQQALPSQVYCCDDV